MSVKATKCLPVLMGFALFFLLLLAGFTANDWFYGCLGVTATDGFFFTYLWFYCWWWGLLLGLMGSPVMGFTATYKVYCSDLPSLSQAVN
jgi:hypothetical protein